MVFLGKNRIGNVKLLKKLCLENNINFNPQDSVNLNNQRISSSRIRKIYSQAGKIKGLIRCSLYPFSIIGTVVHGEKTGRKLGYKYQPLSILKTNAYQVVEFYASKMSVEGGIYNAATYIENVNNSQ